MKKLLLKGLLVASILGVGAVSVNFVDYSGIPTQHGPSTSSVELVAFASTTTGNYQTLGIPTQH